MYTEIVFQTDIRF